MLSLAVALPLQAQRRIRIGPTITAVSLQDATGSSHSFTAFGGTLAFLTGDDSELGLVVARYADLAADDCVRNLTFVALDSYFYPVGAGGIAPYAVTEVGLGRLRESFPAFGCGLLPNVQQSTQLGLAYGLGVRVSGGQWIAATVEGRFFQVPNSAIQSLEARAAVAATFGPRRKTDLGAGTLGPVISYLIPVAGPLRARAPFAGVRFRRDTQKRGTLGLQIDYAPLEITASCSARCAPFAILFAPGYEASAHASWGRFYGTAGIMLAGFPSAGDDRGMAQGLHGGIGADLFSGRLMTNVSARLLWIQRNSDENVFGVQVGVSLSPRLERPVAGALGH
jgi:hypothetical protein